MQAGTVSRSVLTETDFKLSVRQALKEDACTVNLIPKSDADKEKIVISVPSLKLKSNDPEPIIEAGKTFKGDIEVVKMEVRAKTKTDTNREFIAYYKKTNIGKLNTVAGEICGKDPDDSTKFKLDGCYTEKCSLDYVLGDNPDTPATETDYFSCEAQACHPVVLQVAGSRFPCKWGELYRPGATPKCDKRESKNGGSCDKPTGSKFIGNEKTSRKPDDDDPNKCICPSSSRIETVDGLCMTLEKSYTSKDCWPRDDSYNFQSNQSAWTTAKGNFCSKEYQGTEICVWHNLRPSLNTEVHGLGVLTYYKRFYNRETGEVNCRKFVRTYTSRPGGCGGVPPGKICEPWSSKGRIFKINRVPESWFYPQQ